MLASRLKGATSATVLPNLQYVDFGESASTTSATKTLSIDIGTASNDRWVIVLMQFSNGGTRSLSSATINGVSATIGFNIANTSTAFGFCSFFANVTSGSGSQTVTAILTGTTNSGVSRFSVYTLTGRNTLSYVANTATNAATTTSRTTTLDSPADGFNLNMYSTSTIPTSGSWSGTPSTPVDQSPVNIRQPTSAFENWGNAQQSVTATFSHSNSMSVRMITSSYTYT